MSKVDTINRKHEKYVAGASTFSKSVLHYNKACKITPGGAQTISKFPSRFTIGSYPLYISKAKGNCLFDTDGNSFFDWTSGLGSNILSYTDKDVNLAIKNQLDKGINYSLSSEIEYELCELITSIIHSKVMVKLLCTGSDSTNAAVRIARAYTGKNRIGVCKECYHGTGDWFAHSMDYHNGVPEYNSNGLAYFTYNNINTVKFLIDTYPDLAAIILEPTILDNPNIEFLKELQEICEISNVLVIYDEMVCGIRSPKYAVQNLVGTVPDISCFGKSLGNGMSISAIVGKEDIISLFNVDEENPVFYSGTYFGNCINIASAIATLKKIIKTNNSYYPTKIGKILSESGIFKSTNYYRMIPTYKNNIYKSVFMEKLAEQGLLIGNVVYPNYTHSVEDAKNTVNKITEVTKELIGKTEVQLKKILKGKECNNFNLRK